MCSGQGAQEQDRSHRFLFVEAIIRSEFSTDHNIAHVRKRVEMWTQELESCRMSSLIESELIHENRRHVGDYVVFTKILSPSHTPEIIYTDILRRFDQSLSRFAVESRDKHA